MFEGSGRILGVGGNPYFRFELEHLKMGLGFRVCGGRSHLEIYS